MSAQDAAALPASGEAAVRVLEETRVGEGDTVLIVGGAGSVGLVATQLAVGLGAKVLATARAEDAALLEGLGAVALPYGSDLAAAVRGHVPGVDVVIDAAGKGVLATALDLAGGSERVVTLSDPAAGGLGVRLSGPDEAHITRRIESATRRLAEGRLQLRAQHVAPLAEAADIHQGLETGRIRAKVLLTAAV